MSDDRLGSVAEIAGAVRAGDVSCRGVAQSFLERDVCRLGEHFERRGLHRPWRRIAHDLWTAWLFADLVPEELRGLTT